MNKGLKQEMTTQELKAKFNNEFRLDEWPKTYEVDSSTYGNVCNDLINRLVNDIGLFMDWDKLELRENTTWQGFFRTVSISIGPNNGIMFKNVELILKND